MLRKQEALWLQRLLSVALRRRASQAPAVRRRGGGGRGEEDLHRGASSSLQVDSSEFSTEGDDAEDDRREKTGG